MRTAALTLNVLSTQNGNWPCTKVKKAISICAKALRFLGRALRLLIQPPPGQERIEESRARYAWLSGRYA